MAVEFGIDDPFVWEKVEQAAELLRKSGPDHWLISTQETGWERNPYTRFSCVTGILLGGICC